MTPEENKYKYTEINHEDNNGAGTRRVEVNETVNHVTPTSYTNGYTHGQAVERSRQREELRERDEENKTNRWLVFGILLPTTAALLAGLLWSLNRLNEAQQINTAPVVVPVPQRAQSPVPRQTTIIERTREVPVPIPQASPTAPDVNVIVPGSSTSGGSSGGGDTGSSSDTSGTSGASTRGNSDGSTTTSPSSGNVQSYPSSSYTTTPSPQPTVDAPGANDVNNLPISPTNPSTNTTNSTNPTGPSNNPTTPTNP